MFQQIRIYDWLLEIDAEQSRKLSERESEECTCLYCRNFYEASGHLSPSVSDFLAKLGINPAQPHHLSDFPAENQRNRIYIGNYRLVGRVLKGELCTNSEWKASNTLQVNNFRFGFSQESQLETRVYDVPVLHLEFEASIPWMLDEEPGDV